MDRLISDDAFKKVVNNDMKIIITILLLCAFLTGCSDYTDSVEEIYDSGRVAFEEAFEHQGEFFDASVEITDVVICEPTETRQAYTLITVQTADGLEFSLIRYDRDYAWAFDYIGKTVDAKFTIFRKDITSSEEVHLMRLENPEVEVMRSLIEEGTELYKEMEK